MLVIFNGQIISGSYQEVRPECWKLNPDGSWVLVKWDGWFYVARNGSVYRSGDEPLKFETKYIGSSLEEGLHVYLFGDEVIGVIVRDNEVVYGGQVLVYKHNNLQVFGFERLEEYGDGYLYSWHKKLWIKDNKIDKFDYWVNSEVFRWAVERRQIELVKKLSYLYTKGVKSIGKFGLDDILNGKVDMDKVVKELQKADVQEALFCGLTFVRWNFQRVLNYVDKVSGWEGNYNEIVIRVDKDSVYIVDMFSGIANFYVGSRFIKKCYYRCKCSNEVHRIISLCKRYPLDEGLDDDGIKEWAGLVKVCKVKWY